MQLEENVHSLVLIVPSLFSFSDYEFIRAGGVIFSHNAFLSLQSVLISSILSSDDNGMDSENKS